jgi:hypothetical protein
MVELGLLSGRGFGVDIPASAHKTWGSARAGAHAGFAPTRSLHFALQGDFGLPFGRPHFLLSGTELFRPAAVVGGGRVLVELHFP